MCINTIVTTRLSFMHVFRQLFLLACTVLTVDSIESQSSKYLHSCLNAQIFENRGRYCEIATWTSALLYNNQNGNLSYFDPGFPLTVSQQNNYATALYSTLTGGKDVSSDCGLAVKRLACVTSFPKCQSVGISLSSISYFPPCRLQCEQASVRCPSLKLSCEQYATQDCFLYTPAGFFVLPPHQGPYAPLPVLYTVVLVAWLVITALWNYWAFVVEKDSCVLLCRAIAGIPVIKCIALIFAVSFWSTCTAWSMCSFWMSVALVNTHLVFETGEIVLFLLIAKGWSITRENFDANEWRSVVLAMSLFYMCNSIIIVLESSVLSPQEFWICTAALYGLMYVYILKSTVKELLGIADQVSFLGPHLAQDLTSPLKQKYHMYICFLFLVLVSILMEVYTHALVVDNGKLWFILVSYEVSNLLILGTIGWIFRPRQFSPFFFMVPARLAENGSQRVPMLDISPPVIGTKRDGFYYSSGSGDVDDDEAAVIELAPLIPLASGAASTAIGGAESHLMVVINEPVHSPSSKYFIGLK